MTDHLTKDASPREGSDRVPGTFTAATMSGLTQPSTALLQGHDHLHALTAPLARLHDDVDRLQRWGDDLAAVLLAGGRLLAVGNGGSAAQALHLTSELVGRYRDDRPPFAAVCLAADLASLTAIGNDYGIEELFARQVRAHGRPGDVLVALSTSGRSANVLAAVRAARAIGVRSWGMTGSAGTPLASLVDDVLAVEGAVTATVQEVHQVAIHLLCARVDAAVARYLSEAHASESPTTLEMIDVVGSGNRA